MSRSTVTEGDERSELAVGVLILPLLSVGHFWRAAPGHSSRALKTLCADRPVRVLRLAADCERPASRACPDGFSRSLQRPSSASEPGACAAKWSATDRALVWYTTDGCETTRPVGRARTRIRACGVSRVEFLHRTGGIQLSVISHSGKQAIVSTLRTGDFLGEGALASHPVRLETATATMASAVLVIPKRQMIRLLHTANTRSRIGSSPTC